MSISRTRAVDARSLKSIPKRILVIGGAGFLGSHLCDRFLAEGHEVICVDNFYSSTKQNIQHMMGNPSFECIRHDVTFPLNLKVIKKINPRSSVVYSELPVNDPTQRKPNISLAREKLNDWKPAIDIDEGLYKTIAYFKRNVGQSISEAA